MEWYYILLAGMIALFFITKKWFWKLVFLAASVALLYATIISAMDSQLLWALGFFLLTGVCCRILGFISSK